MRRPYSPLTIKEASALVLCPPGSLREQQELGSLETLLALCNTQGYGRIAQIVGHLEDLWRHPDKLSEYQELQKDAIALLEEDRRAFNALTS